MYTNLVALTAGLAATASAFDCTGAYFNFFNRRGPSMSYQRLDPALFPGQESPHLHSFDGGNALASDMTFGTTQDSSCTTARIKPDKSLYWRPTLFWNGNNTGYYRVPDQELKIYYKFGDAGNANANVSEFPENFRMMAGNPFLRSDDGTNSKGPNVGWSCKPASGPSIDAVGFPKGFNSCPNGFAAQITFPSCWNGKDLDTANPNAHMAWPTNSGTGIMACPAGFQHSRFPTVFIEFWYDVSSFDKTYGINDTPWVLSNGDPTGYGFHADFLNGWKKGVLANAVDPKNPKCKCGCGCNDDDMKACFGDDQVNTESDSAFKSCSANAAYAGDDMSVLDKLPGCNPVQPGPAMATQASGVGCAAAPATTLGGKSSATPSSTYSAAVSSMAASSAIISSKAVSSASIVRVSRSALPSISLSIPNKGVGDASYGFATPSTTLTKAVSSSLVFDDIATRLPTLSLPVTSAAPAQTDECKEPVYITITPTVYVTAGAEMAGNSTSCSSTFYETVTNKVTITVQPTATGKHRSHHVAHSHY